jgi:glycolate oxidase FAD binding subunit
VVAPASVAELGGIVRRAAVEGQAIYPLGGRTMLDLGLPPTKRGVGVDLTGLNQVIDYPARDMTITVQAGITIAKLQEILATEKQQLPVDVPSPEHATLGGTLATNASGPRRYGYGTLRDYVIGISWVNDEGQEVKAGGRVVKNVAGYDLCKLHIGALGTLGVITQVTLKLRPVPETHAVLVIGCQAVALGDLLERLHGSSTRPICIDIIAPPPIAADFQVIVGFAGGPETVAWQVDRLQQELRPEFFGQVVSSPEAMKDLHQLAQTTSNAASRLTFKVNALPRALPDLLRTAWKLQCSCLQAHAGNGIVLGHVTGDLTLDRAQTMLKTLQEAAGAAQGNVVVLRCPPEWKRTLPVWGAPRGDWWLMRNVKEKLDPSRLFNPGRFVDGI